MRAGVAEGAAATPLILAKKLKVRAQGRFFYPENSSIQPGLESSQGRKIDPERDLDGQFHVCYLSFRT